MRPTGPITDEQRRAVRRILTGQEDEPVTLGDPTGPDDVIPAEDVLSELEQLVHPHTIQLAAQRIAARRLMQALAESRSECDALQRALAEGAGPDEQGDDGHEHPEHQ